MPTRQGILTSPMAGGTELCFDKNEFMKSNFSVDEFLHKNRSAPSLEQLRDNLGMYLKGLRSSMIDLINEDYADFVSLSANLVGLDQSIGTIKKPLEQFREEISVIKLLINENEEEIHRYLDQKNQLRILKRNLQSLKKVYESVNKLEELLTHQLSTENIKPVDLERAALELIQLKFNMKFCVEYLSEEQTENIAKLNLDVLKKLRILFNSTLKTTTSTATENLERCLRIYITLDACSIAEEVFREDVVATYMTTIISEQSLQNSPQGLAGIYNKILNFISLHMTDLLRITQYTDKMRGFNFLVNSFWSDVEMRLEAHMSSIFAPGNSEVFFAKYKCTRDFMHKIEEILASEEYLRVFRSHSQTKSFQSRWNLPVYFQICFQEIAGPYEAILDPVLSDNKLKEAATEDDYHLTPFRSAQKSVERCWSDGVYLEEVFPKFYKLTVQIVLRLSRWISDAIRLTTSQAGISLKLTKTNLLIHLHTDTTKFVAKLAHIEQTIVANIPTHKREQNSDTIKTSINDLKINLEQHLETIGRSIIDILITESLENIRQVNDLPRLYRKTNREVPNRSSTYIEQMLKPIKNFGDNYKNNLDDKIVANILSNVFSKITTEYYTAVSDVLTSVQKTEESLRRLRNLKEKSATVANQQTTMAAAVMSDDDKIRLQLRVDVIAWTAELAKLQFMPTQIDKLLDLNKIVDETLKAKEGEN